MVKAIILALLIGGCLALVNYLVCSKFFPIKKIWLEEQNPFIRSFGLLCWLSTMFLMLGVILYFQDVPSMENGSLNSDVFDIIVSCVWAFSFFWFTLRKGMELVREKNKKSDEKN